MLKDAAVLFIITLISGAILGGVYELTKEPIAAMEQAASEKAMVEVFNDAAGFEACEVSETAEEMHVDGADVNSVSKAIDSDGNLLGYVITVTSHEGYGGDIKFSMGIRNDGTLNGLSLLSISETAGLGMKAGDVLVPQFAGKKAESFVYSKTGATAENEIDAISGATITTNAVTNAVNLGMSLFHSGILEGGAN